MDPFGVIPKTTNTGSGMPSLAALNISNYVSTAFCEMGPGGAISYVSQHLLAQDPEKLGSVGSANLQLLSPEEAATVLAKAQAEAKENPERSYAWRARGAAPGDSSPPLDQLQSEQCLVTVSAPGWQGCHCPSPVFPNRTCTLHCDGISCKLPASQSLDPTPIAWQQLAPPLGFSHKIYETEQGEVVYDREAAPLSIGLFIFGCFVAAAICGGVVLVSKRVRTRAGYSYLERNAKRLMRKAEKQKLKQQKADAKEIQRVAKEYREEQERERRREREQRERRREGRGETSGDGTGEKASKGWFGGGAKEKKYKAAVGAEEDDGGNVVVGIRSE